ncbi:MAG: transcriptional regulator [Thaumarchaeota archaeon]|nr:transcriptional regulator [Nitrososphaerota archaeon]MBI3023194.1 transcriptional regulator [Nitrososphaerota archaeon]MCS4540160.1 transcriptional regulator [Nitrososphaerota archaeon]
MANDRALGGAIFGGSIIGIIIYAGLLYLPQTSFIVLQITAFLAVVVLLGILAWIGWTMATTPPPEPITDLSSGGEMSSTGSSAQETTGDKPSSAAKK